MSCTESPLVLGLACAMALSALPHEASACGACICYTRDTDPWVVPDCARAVPRNLRPFVWLARIDPSTLELASEAGEAVDYSLTSAGVPDCFWLEPREPLAANTTYELKAEWREPAGLFPPHTVFTTGDSEDHAPPLLGAVSVSERGWGGGLCFPAVGGALAIEQVVDEYTVTSFSVVQLNLEGHGQTSRAFLPFLSVPGNSEPFGRSLDESGSDCFGMRQFSRVSEKARYTLTATVWDWAGNSAAAGPLDFEATLSDDVRMCGPSETPAPVSVDAGSSGPGTDSTVVDSVPVLLEGRGGCGLARAPAGQWRSFGLIPLAFVLLQRALRGLHVRVASLRARHTPVERRDHGAPSV